jgi:hypothetical protein
MGEEDDIHMPDRQTAYVQSPQTEKNFTVGERVVAQCTSKRMRHFIEHLVMRGKMSP